MRARVGVGVGVRGRVRGTSREHLVGLVEHEVVDVVHRQRAPVDHVKHAPRRAWSGLRSGSGSGSGSASGVRVRVRVRVSSGVGVRVKRTDDELDARAQLVHVLAHVRATNAGLPCRGRQGVTR